MTQDTGGPAYPYGREWNRDRSEISRWEENGMTLLDYFAGQFASSVNDSETTIAGAAHMLGISTEEYSSRGFPWPEAVAKEAYRLAEAMIAEKRRLEEAGKDGA